MSEVKYTVIVPCFNEEEVIKETHTRLSQVMGQTGESFELLYVNDGSRDKTAQIIAEIAREDENVRLVNFSRNFGHQLAVTAGMDYAGGEAVVVIDADLQDPPQVILEMIKLWKEGYDVVYGQRLKREGETAFKKATAKMYYRFLRKLTTVDIPVDTGDFRLMDRKVVDTLKRFTERNRFIRGMVSWVGFKQTAVQFAREPRFAGETKYPLKRMLKFAIDGITAFSYKPLKLATTIGFFISFLSFAYLVVVFAQRIFTSTTITGWASTIAVILFSQGIILMILGIMGEYIGRIYDEIKNRPMYIVAEEIGFSKEVVEK